MSQHEKAAVTVPATGDTEIVAIPNVDKKLLCMHVGVITQALDNFDVLGRAHAGGELQDFTPANWAALAAGQRIRFASGNLAAQAAASAGYFEMDIEGLVEIVVRASGAVDSAVVTPRWSLV
jgi:hypothetical protein